MWHPCVFGKHSRSIRHVWKMFGKHASSSWCIRNENLEVLGSICFPNIPNGPRTWRMLPGHFQNACGMHAERVWSILGRFAMFWKHLESMQEVFGLFWKHSETILKTFGKQTENKRKITLFGGTFSQFTTFVFGKQTEWHSGQCDWSITSSNLKSPVPGLCYI